MAEDDLNKLVGFFFGAIVGLMLVEILSRLLGYKCPRCGAETKGQIYCPNCGFQVRR